MVRDSDMHDASAIMGKEYQVGGIANDSKEKPNRVPRNWHPRLVFRRRTARAVLGTSPA
jgi:hypothetical protein